jgi:hypothetical protein
VTNTLAYWIHTQVAKKIKCCEYGPRSIFLRGPYRLHLGRLMAYLKKYIRLGLKSLKSENDTEQNFYNIGLSLKLK